MINNNVIKIMVKDGCFSFNGCIKLINYWESLFVSKYITLTDFAKVSAKLSRKGVKGDKIGKTIKKTIIALVNSGEIPTINY